MENEEALSLAVKPLIKLLMNYDSKLSKGGSALCYSSVTDGAPLSPAMIILSVSLIPNIMLVICFLPNEIVH